MAEVFRLRPREGSEWVLPESEFLVPWMVQFDGSPAHSTWQAPLVSVLHETRDGGPRAKSDFPWFSTSFVALKGRAVSKLGPILAEYGEILPMRSPEESEIALFSCLTFVDALDWSRSEFDVSSDGRKMAVEEYVFLPNLVDNLLVFKPTGFAKGPTLVTNAFRDLVEDLQLEGAEFEQVWHDRTG